MHCLNSFFWWLGGKGIVKTGISLACPPGTYGRIAPRSGLAVKKFIDVGAGVIDADYRGEVGVVLFNFGDEDFTVNVGDRVAQLVLEKICMADAVEVEELTETERGAGGFGSTGVSAQQTISVGTKRPISPIELLDDSPMDDLFIYLDSISNDLPTDVREKVKKSILAGSAEVKMLLRVCSKTGNVKSLIESMNILQ